MNLTKSYGSFLRRCRLPSRSCKFVIDVGEVSFVVFFFWVVTSAIPMCALRTQLMLLLV